MSSRTSQGPVETPTSTPPARTPHRNDGPHGRGPRSWGLAFGVVLVLGLLVLGPVTSAATPAPTRTWTAPYGAGLGLTGLQSIARCHANATISTPPFAHASSGSIGLAMNVSTPGCGSASAVGLAGFLLPFPVHFGRNKLHTVTADWSFAWSALARGSSCPWFRGGHTYATGVVTGTLYLLVLDLANGSVVASSPSAVSFVSLSSHSVVSNSTGTGNYSLNATGRFTAGQSYEIETFAQVSISAGFCTTFFTHVPEGSGAWVDVAGAGYGGQLVRATFS
jgi:hypothetical protein